MIYGCNLVISDSVAASELLLPMNETPRPETQTIITTTELDSLQLDSSVDQPSPCSQYREQLVAMGFEEEIVDVSLAICTADNVPAENIMETALQWLLLQDGVKLGDPRSIELNHASPPERHDVPDSSARPSRPILKNPSWENSLNSSRSSSLFKKDWFSQALNSFTKLKIGSKHSSNESLKAQKEMSKDKQTNTTITSSRSNVNEDPSIQLFKISNSCESVTDQMNPITSVEKRVKFSYPDIRIPFDPEESESENNSSTYERERMPEDHHQSSWTNLIRTDTLTRRNEKSKRKSLLDISHIQHEFSPIPFPEQMNPTAWHHHYLTCCQLRHTEPISKLVIMLRSLPSNSTTISKLDLSGSHINSRNVIPLLDFLSMNLGITEFNFEKCDIDDETLKHLLNNFMTYSKPTHISLAGNTKIKSEGIRYCAIVIKNFTWLHSLNLSGIAIEKKDAAMLSSALGRMNNHHGERTVESSSLRSLILDGCKIKNCLDILAPGIQYSALEHLSLRQNKLGPEQASMIIQLLDQSQRNQNQSDIAGIKSLDLRGNELGHSVNLISGSLALHSSLRRLNLRDNKLDATDLISLCHSLKKNKFLKALDLSGNSLFSKGDQEAKEFKEFLISGCPLEELYLDNTNITGSVSIAIAEALAMIKNLRILFLRYNPLDLAGIMALSVAMRMNFAITELEVIPLIDIDEAEEESLAALLNDISIYLQRNVEISGSPTQSIPSNAAQKENEKLNQLIKNIPSIENTANLLQDIVGPGLFWDGLKSPSQEQLVENLYSECVRFQRILKEFEGKVIPNPSEESRINEIKQAVSVAVETYQKERETLLRPKAEVLTRIDANLDVPLRQTSTFSLSEVDEILKHANFDGLNISDSAGTEVEDIEAFLQTAK